MRFYGVLILIFIEITLGSTRAFSSERNKDVKVKKHALKIMRAINLTETQSESPCLKAALKKVVDQITIAKEKKNEAKQPNAAAVVIQEAFTEGPAATAVVQIETETPPPSMALVLETGNNSGQSNKTEISPETQEHAQNPPQQELHPLPEEPVILQEYEPSIEEHQLSHHEIKPLIQEQEQLSEEKQNESIVESQPPTQDQENHVPIELQASEIHEVHELPPVELVPESLQWKQQLPEEDTKLPQQEPQEQVSPLISLEQEVHSPQLITMEQPAVVEAKVESVLTDENNASANADTLPTETPLMIEENSTSDNKCNDETELCTLNQSNEIQQQSHIIEDHQMAGSDEKSVISSDVSDKNHDEVEGEDEVEDEVEDDNDDDEYYFQDTEEPAETTEDYSWYTKPEDDDNTFTDYDAYDDTDDVWPPTNDEFKYPDDDFQDTIVETQHSNILDELENSADEGNDDDMTSIENIDSIEEIDLSEKTPSSEETSSSEEGDTAILEALAASTSCAESDSTATIPPETSSELQPSSSMPVDNFNDLKEDINQLDTSCASILIRILKRLASKVEEHQHSLAIPDIILTSNKELSNVTILSTKEDPPLPHSNPNKKDDVQTRFQPGKIADMSKLLKNVPKPNSMQVLKPNDVSMPKMPKV